MRWKRLHIAGEGSEEQAIRCWQIIFKGDRTPYVLTNNMQDLPLPSILSDTGSCQYFFSLSSKCLVGLPVLWLDFLLWEIMTQTIFDRMELRSIISLIFAVILIYVPVFLCSYSLGHHFNIIIIQVSFRSFSVWYFQCIFMLALGIKIGTLKCSQSLYN